MAKKHGKTKKTPRTKSSKKNSPADISASPVVDALVEAADMTLTSNEVRPVHQLRVNCRRLDVWFRLAKLRPMRDELTWLRRSAGDVRDLDVLMTMDIPPGWERSLRMRRYHAHKRLKSVIEDERTTALIAAVSERRPTSYKQAVKVTQGLLDQVLRAGRKISKASAEVEDFHRVRIRVKRLRYALEWLGGSTELLTEAQDLFGALNDVDMLLIQLRERPPKTMPEGYYEYCLEQLIDYMEEIRQTWQKTSKALKKLRLG